MHPSSEIADLTRIDCPNHSCCACPQTKSARDDCFLKFGGSEADEKCKALVQEHIACMQSLGFKLTTGST
ncbi:cytochrome c oxidase copper chaperone-like protein [Russula dissimulans]|nr:cytochrome c oxidase copper chaperone-like protein [Russula dissimulans]